MQPPSSASPKPSSSPDPSSETPLPPPSSVSPEPSFESLLRDLTSIVKQLEAGEIPLEDALRLYEQGVKLSRLSLSRLDSAERIIEILQRDPDTGIETRQPFSTDLSGRRSP